MHNELIKIARILHSKKCNKLIKLIKDNPGINLVELQMAMKENHHSIISKTLSELKECSLINMVRDGKTKRVYFNYNAEKPLQLMDNLAKMLVDAND